MSRFELDEVPETTVYAKTKPPTHATYHVERMNETDFVVTRTRDDKTRSIAVQPSLHQIVNRQKHAPSDRLLHEMLSHAHDLPSWVPAHDTSRAACAIMKALVADETIAALITNGIVSLEDLDTKDHVPFRIRCAHHAAKHAIDTGIEALWRVASTLGETTDIQRRVTRRLFDTMHLFHCAESDTHAEHVAAAITNENAFALKHLVDAYGDEALARILEATVSADHEHHDIDNDTLRRYLERTREANDDLVSSLVDNYAREGCPTPCDLLLDYAETWALDPETETLIPRNVKSLRLSRKAEERRQVIQAKDPFAEPHHDAMPPLAEGEQVTARDRDVVFCAIATQGNAIALERKTSRTTQTLVLMPEKRQFYIRQDDEVHAVTKETMTSFTQNMPPVRLVRWLPAIGRGTGTNTAHVVNAITDDRYMDMVAKDRIDVDSRTALRETRARLATLHTDTETCQVAWDAIEAILGHDRARNVLSTNTGWACAARRMLDAADNDMLLDMIGRDALFALIKAWYRRACEKDSYRPQEAYLLDAHGHDQSVTTIVDIATLVPKDKRDGLAAYVIAWLEQDSYQQTPSVFLENWNLVLAYQLETAKAIIDPYPRHLETLCARIKRAEDIHKGDTP
jgi:hypothetical protein